MLVTVPPQFAARVSHALRSARIPNGQPRRRWTDPQAQAARYDIARRSSCLFLVSFFQSSLYVLLCNEFLVRNSHTRHKNRKQELKDRRRQVSPRELQQRVKRKVISRRCALTVRFCKRATHMQRRNDANPCACAPCTR